MKYVIPILLRPAVFPMRGLVRAVVVFAAFQFASVIQAQTALHSWAFAGSAYRALDVIDWSGWGAYGDAPATNHSTTIETSDSHPRLYKHGVAGAGGEPGVLYFHAGRTSGSINDRFVVTTTFDALSLSGDNLGSISWAQAFNDLSTSVRLLVQSGGQWYASSEAFTVSTASSGKLMTNEEIKTLDLTGSSGLGTTAWSTISFGDAQSISRSATPIDSPIGTSITGIGFLVQMDVPSNYSGSNRVFIDDVQILTAVPEPSTGAALAGIAALGSVLLARRRR